MPRTTFPQRSSITRLVASMLCGLLLTVPLSACSDNTSGPDPAAGQAGTPAPADTPAALAEALDRFKAQGLFYDDDEPPAIADAAALNRFLKRYDPNAVFLPPEALAAFQKSQKANYVGIGMEIEKNDAGEIVCFPIPGFPARQAGVQSGDRLIAVDGRPVTGRSVYEVAAWLMGADGTRVRLLVAKKGDALHRIEIIRKRIQTRSVTVDTMGGLTIIKIHYFNSGTRRQLQLALAALTPSSRLVLDLRDNPGGDLYKSIDAAMLFLENGALIVSIQNRTAIQPYRSTTAAAYTASPLVIWQNRHTASAAEVFTAALTENDRAVSIGVESYGKGTTQEVAELSDGSALVFTSGYLLTPQGKRYHDRGLKPVRRLSDEDLSTLAYLKTTERIFGDRPASQISNSTNSNKSHPKTGEPGSATCLGRQTGSSIGIRADNPKTAISIAASRIIKALCRN